MPDSTPPELVVTNVHRNFTGVSSTIDQLLRFQEQRYDVLFSGTALPAVKLRPVSIWRAISRSSTAPAHRPHIIWHVRRNCEMFWALVARDLLRLPIKTVFTSAAIRTHSAYPRWLISRMDAVIATSAKAAELVPNVVSVVPHGVDIERFRPATDRDQAWRDTGYPGSVGVATVGRVRPEKGTDLFVDAMIRLLPDRPGVTALIIGKCAAKHAGFQAELQKKIDQAGLGDRILFTGQVDKDSLPEMLSAVSLLVAPPRYEGYGMTPLEAMASGTPVVVSDTGAFAAFVANGDSGRLVPVGDLELTCEAVADLLDHKPQLERLSKGARKTAVAQFSLEGELQGIDRVYREVWGEEQQLRLAS